MARTILDEVLGVRPDLIEHQLAHAVRDPNGRAYNRFFPAIAVCISLLWFCIVSSALAAPESESFPLGTWVAPGVKTPFFLTLWRDDEQRLILSPGQNSEEPRSCPEEKQEQGIWQFACASGKKIALVKISTDAMFFFDGWITQMLLVRPEQATKTSCPSGRWVEGRNQGKDRVTIDFEQGIYRSGRNEFRFQTSPSDDQMAFPGLTTLFGPNGRAVFECVRMGHSVLACRRPAQGQDGDHPFIGFAPIIKGEPER